MERMRLEQLLMKVLDTKGPQTTRMLMRIFLKPSKLYEKETPPIDDEILATIANLEASRKIIRNIERGTWTVVKTEGPKMQNRKSVNKTPIESTKILDHSFDEKITPQIEDDSESKGPNLQLPNEVNNPIPKFKCPNPACNQVSQYRPHTKTKQSSRERKVCPHCKKKFDLKFWIPMDQILDQKDQTSATSQSVNENSIESTKNLDHKGPELQNPGCVKKFYSELSKLENDILELIDQGYFAATIGKNLGVPTYTLSRMIKKLVRMGYLYEIPKSYPKLYQRSNPNSSPIAKNNLPKAWPRSTDIHSTRFITPITKLGSLAGAHFNNKFKGGGMYVFNPKNNSDVPHDWKFQITSKSIISNYRWDIDKVKDIATTTLDLQKQIPWAYFLARGFEFDIMATRLVQNQHCNFKNMSKLGQKVTGTIECDGKEIHVDHSQDEQGDLETDAATAQSIIDVPEKIDDLAVVTAGLENSLNHLSAQVNTNQASLGEVTETLQNQLAALNQKMDQMYQSQIVVVKALTNMMKIPVIPSTTPAGSQPNNNFNYI